MSIKRLLLFPIWFIALVLVFTTCSKPEQGFTPSHFNSGNGLPGDYIKDMCGDKSGNIWMIVQKRITVADIHYVMLSDGSLEVRYTSSHLVSALVGINKDRGIFHVTDWNTNPLFLRSIECIECADDGRVFLGASWSNFFGLPKSHILVYDQVSTKIYTDSPFANQISLGYNFADLTIDPFGELWFTSGNNLFGDAHYNYSNSLLSNESHFVKKWKDQGIWILSFTRIYQKPNGGIIKRVSYNNGGAQYFYTSMASDKFGDLWVLGFKHEPITGPNFKFQLQKISGDPNAVTIEKHDLPDSISIHLDYNDLAVGPDNSIWITNGESNLPGGLLNYKPDSFELLSFNLANSNLHSNELTCLSFDSFGNLWVGSADAGVKQINFK